MREFNPVRAKTVLSDKKLYKYRSFDKGREFIVEDIILRNKIRFAKPQELNDDLECMPQYILGNYSSESYRKKLVRWAIKTQRHIGKNINKKAFKKYVRSLPREEHQKKIDEINKDNQELLNDKWRILSLSSNPVQPEIWRRYADDGKGVCLIFDASTFEFGGAFKVYYPENRLEVDITSQDLHDILLTTILTKTLNWAYEEEYRVIASREWEGYTVILESDQFFQFDPSLLKGLILGDKISSSSRQKILDMNELRKCKLDIWHLARSVHGELSMVGIAP